jgi:hypothetical protein
MICVGGCIVLFCMGIGDCPGADSAEIVGPLGGSRVGIGWPQGLYLDSLECFAHASAEDQPCPKVPADPEDLRPPAVVRAWARA